MAKWVGCLIYLFLSLSDLDFLKCLQKHNHFMNFLQIAGIGHVNSFGLIYNDFINETHCTAKSLTSAHGVFAIMLAIGGKLSEYLPY